MQYQNPKIPEGINVSKTHPLVEFFSTHPDLEQRIERLQNVSAGSDIALVTLPIEFRIDP
ncbi:MAG: hypothetical protein O7F73_03545 [Gammaproteobacteria bacterium]|nr:hypothetical protein [Gammaproteobacteria bacterium]